MSRSGSTQPVKPSSNRAAAQPFVGGGAGDEGVLRETRKLLNALNEENAELKSQNDVLNDKLRRASDAVASLTDERDAMEKDMKDINFNLMQQLRNKTLATKELETRLEEMASKERASASELHRTERQRQELESEMLILHERLAVADEAHRKLQRKLDDVGHTSEAGKGHARELQEEIQRQRELLRRSQEESDSERVSWVAELKAERKRTEELQLELRATTESMSRQIASLTADARRVATAESEALFAHDQMATVSQLIFDQLTTTEQTLRGVMIVQTEQNAAVEQQLHHVQGLRHDLQLFRQHDEQLVAYLLNERRTYDGEIRSLTKTVEQLRSELVAASATHNGTTTEYDRLRLRLQQLETEHHQLQETLASSRASEERLKAQCADASRQLEQQHHATIDMQKALSEADAALSISAEANARLERDLAAERGRSDMQAQQHRIDLERCATELDSERQKHEEAVIFLEEENDVLQQQLRDHTEMLGTALARISSSASHARRSHSHRSFSTDSVGQAPPHPQRCQPTMPSMLNGSDRSQQSGIGPACTLINPHPLQPTTTTDTTTVDSVSAHQHTLPRNESSDLSLLDRSLQEAVHRSAIIAAKR